MTCDLRGQARLTVWKQKHGEAGGHAVRRWQDDVWPVPNAKAGQLTGLAVGDCHDDVETGEQGGLHSWKLQLDV
jgi:hypothetical protein